jgi:hypothetical protein
MEEDKERRELEIQTVLANIKAAQARQRRKWRLDVTLPMLAAQGVGMFVVGVLVGTGLGIVLQLIYKEFFSG